MPWFMVDDDMTFHPKTLAAGNDAMGMWVRAGSWCQKQLNGGFVPPEMVAALGGKELAEKLVSAGLWTKNRSGYRFHQWEERQMSKEEVENRRKLRMEAGRKGGVKSGESRRRSKNEANASPSASAEPKHQAKQQPKQTGSPVPCPSSLKGQFRGEGYVSERAGESPPPGNLDSDNPRCPDHVHIPASDRGPNCTGCARVRKWCEAEPARRQALIRENARIRRDCPHCDDSGLIEGSDGKMRRCQEHEEIA